MIKLSGYKVLRDASCCVSDVGLTDRLLDNFFVAVVALYCVRRSTGHQKILCCFACVCDNQKSLTTSVPQERFPYQNLTVLSFACAHFLAFFFVLVGRVQFEVGEDSDVQF